MPIEDNTDKVIKESNRLVKERLTAAALLVERNAKILCPRKTTTLARSITHKIESKVAYVGSNVEYAPYVELGTRPHTIRPKEAKALHFTVGGKEVFAKVVRHPGTRAKPYLRPALEMSIPQIKRIFGVK